MRWPSSPRSRSPARSGVQRHHAAQVAVQRPGAGQLGRLQWLLTATELAVGISLVVGIASRLGPLLALALIFPLWVMVLDNGRYLYEWPLDIVPLAILAAVPAGRVWGQDGRLAARFGDRWPF